MLVNTHLYATNAYAAPVLHLRRLDGGQLFANYAAELRGRVGRLDARRRDVG